jgi:hypothetical protein
MHMHSGQGWFVSFSNVCEYRCEFNSLGTFLQVSASTACGSPALLISVFKEQFWPQNVPVKEVVVYSDRN